MLSQQAEKIRHGTTKFEAGRQTFRQEDKIRGKKRKSDTWTNPKKDNSHEGLIQVLEDNRNEYFALAPHKENRECERREVIVEQ